MEMAIVSWCLRLLFLPKGNSLETNCSNVVIGRHVDHWPSTRTHIRLVVLEKMPQLFVPDVVHIELLARRRFLWGVDLHRYSTTSMSWRYELAVNVISRTHLPCPRKEERYRQQVGHPRRRKQPPIWLVGQRSKCWISVDNRKHSESCVNQHTTHRSNKYVALQKARACAHTK